MNKKFYIVISALFLMFHLAAIASQATTITARKFPTVKRISSPSNQMVSVNLQILTVLEEIQDANFTAEP